MEQAPLSYLEKQFTQLMTGDQSVLRKHEHPTYTTVSYVDRVKNDFLPEVGAWIIGLANDQPIFEFKKNYFREASGGRNIDIQWHIANEGGLLYLHYVREDHDKYRGITIGLSHPEHTEISYGPNVCYKPDGDVRHSLIATGRNSLQSNRLVCGSYEKTVNWIEQKSPESIEAIAFDNDQQLQSVIFPKVIDFPLWEKRLAHKNRQTLCDNTSWLDWMRQLGIVISTN